MLKHLSISNYAIIDSLEIDFDGHLNIITGETGAGKSIILGALNMILGKRADNSALREAGTKAVVEGVFQIGHLGLEDQFRELVMEYADETIIRREIRPDGKSRAFVNDSPVNLDQLRDLAQQLVDLHTQQDNAAVLDRRFYASILDRLSGQADRVREFEKDYRKSRALERQLIEARTRQHGQASDMDYLEFQYNEISELAPGPSDGRALEEELSILENAGLILEQLQKAAAILDEGEVNAGMMLSEAASHLGRISDLSQALSELHTRLEQAAIDITDIALSAKRIADRTEMDEARLVELRERHGEINRLLQKHQLENVEALMDLQQDIRHRIEGLRALDRDLSAMEEEVAEKRKSLLKDARKISSNRKGQVAKFEKEVTAVLHKVGMPHARIRLEHEILDDGETGPDGIDRFELWFSANKGVEPQSLKNVASGGERSRLMLAVKSVIARYMQLSTMIFDEIDTGISGEVAARVGEIFRHMCRDHQIISITHLPQIAAQATRHLFVFKDDSKDKTMARVKSIEGDERIVEIAKMLSGDKPGDAAILAAKELVGTSVN